MYLLTYLERQVLFAKICSTGLGLGLESTYIISNVCFKKTGKKCSSVLLLHFFPVFLKQTLVILLHLYKQQQISCSLHIFTKNEFRISLNMHGLSQTYSDLIKLVQTCSDLKKYYHLLSFIIIYYYLLFIFIYYYLLLFILMFGFVQIVRLKSPKLDWPLIICICQKVTYNIYRIMEYNLLIFSRCIIGWHLQRKSCRGQMPVSFIWGTSTKWYCHTSKSFWQRWAHKNILKCNKSNGGSDLKALLDFFEDPARSYENFNFCFPV